jgi:hypothetical protein
MLTDAPIATWIAGQIPKTVLILVNQLYEVECKLKKAGDPANIGRNIAKIKDVFAEEGLLCLDGAGRHIRLLLGYEDPLGQPFHETRTDLAATISGTDTDNLIVTEVIKPIIRVTWSEGDRQLSKIVQQGIVIVESRKEQASS